VCALDIALVARRSEVVDNQQGVLGGEGEQFEGIGGARPVAGKVSGVQVGAEMALDEGRQLGLADAGWPGEVKGKFDLA